jgi:hypothetical protein
MRGSRTSLVITPPPPTHARVEERKIYANTAPDKDAASVELAGVAEKATTTKPEALEPWAEDEVAVLVSVRTT